MAKKKPSARAKAKTAAKRRPSGKSRAKKPKAIKKQAASQRGKSAAKATRKAKPPSRAAKKPAKAVSRSTVAKRAARAGAKTAAKKKPTATRTRKPAGRTGASAKPARAKRATPARAATSKKKPSLPRTTKAPVAKKRSRAVEKLLALKAETSKAAKKKDFLIKAPKRAKQENLVSPRFTRRPAPAPPAATTSSGAKTGTRAGRKTTLRKRLIDELRAALQAERDRLIAHLASLDETASLKGPSEVNEDVPGYSIHLAEYATDNQVVETTLAQRALQAERLAEIEQALARIGQPGYGICETCGEPISLERLKIKPFASLCVRCRLMKEQGRL